MLSVTGAEVKQSKMALETEVLPMRHTVLHRDESEGEDRWGGGGGQMGWGGCSLGQVTTPEPPVLTQACCRAPHRCRCSPPGRNMK